MYYNGAALSDTLRVTAGEVLDNFSFQLFNEVGQSIDVSKVAGDKSTWIDWSLASSSKKRGRQAFPEDGILPSLQVWLSCNVMCVAFELTARILCTAGGHVVGVSFP